MPTPPPTIPTLPPTTLVWNGEAVEAAMRKAGLNVSLIGLAMGVHSETVRRWTLPRNNKNSMEPATVSRQNDLAAICGVTLSDFLLRIDRDTGEPLGLVPTA